MADNIFLIEDHDEALKIWKAEKVKNIDLVHIDAHMDFGFHPAKPVQKIFNEAKTIQQLKKSLEYNLAFRRYEKDFDKQTHIGNYIYPAIEEGVVRNFYWVIPGKIEEFERSVRAIKRIFKNLSREAHKRIEFKKKEGVITANFLDRKLVVCILEKLPIFRRYVLVDIDTDFLIIDSLVNADNILKIGKRQPWIFPGELVNLLKDRIKQPKIITIAYSVNGGYTPIKYKHFGDEIGYKFAPKKFKTRFKNNTQAALQFNLFCSTGKAKYYKKAIRLNKAYRTTDNNFGPLYLSLRKFSLAQKEFSRILGVDPENPACLLGLGNIALAKRNFIRAKRFFSLALALLDKEKSDNFRNLRNPLLLSMAKAEFGLNNYKTAKKLLICYKAARPLEPLSYYLLARISEKEKDFPKAVNSYKDAIRLGFGGLEPMSRLLKIYHYIQENDAIIRFVIKRYQEFKTRFIRTKNLSLKKGKEIKGLEKIEKKIAALEKEIRKGGMFYA
jgi:tetratricopeptide (TPR) repeat protein